MTNPNTAPSADSDGGAIDDPFSQARLMRWGKALQAEGNSLGDALVAYADSWSQDWAEAVAPEAKADRAVFEQWYDAQPDGKLSPWDVWQSAIQHAIKSGHACTFALDNGGNLYRRYKEPQCAPPAPPAPLPYPQNLTPAQADARQKLIGLGGGRVGLDDDYEPPAPLPGKESAFLSAVATIYIDPHDERQELEYIGHIPRGELIRLYKAPNAVHADLLNVAIAVRDACHKAWVTSAENWRADVDVKSIVSAALSSPPAQAAPADYPPPDAALAEFTDYFVRNYPGPDTIITDPKWHAPKLFRAAQRAISRAGLRSGVSADPLPRPLLTDLEIQGLRRQARNDPRCADQHWFILMVRAIESYYGVTGAAAQSQPLVEPIADYPPHLADEVERELALMIDRSPEPLRRLSDWLANKLDEDDWKTAERMLLGAVESVADRVQQHQVKKGEPS